MLYADDTQLYLYKKIKYALMDPKPLFVLVILIPLLLKYFAFSVHLPVSIFFATAWTWFTFLSLLFLLSCLISVLVSQAVPPPPSLCWTTSPCASLILSVSLPFISVTQSFLQSDSLTLYFNPLSVCPPTTLLTASPSKHLCLCPAFAVSPFFPCALLPSV